MIVEVKDKDGRKLWACVCPQTKYASIVGKDTGSIQLTKGVQPMRYKGTLTTHDMTRRFEWIVNVAIYKGHVSSMTVIETIFYNDGYSDATMDQTIYRMGD